MSAEIFICRVCKSQYLYPVGRACKRCRQRVIAIKTAKAAKQPKTRKGAAK
jgi:hypothetical protein